MSRRTSSSIAGVALAAGFLLPACQQYASLDRKTYPDAVVSLNQVDPVYRPYFAAQHGANYSLEEQRAAFSKAAQTARGPMPAYVESKPKPKPSGKGASSKGKSTGKGKPTGKKTATQKATGKKNISKPTKKPAATPAKKPSAAPKKPAAKKPAAKKR